MDSSFRRYYFLLVFFAFFCCGESSEVTIVEAEEEANVNFPYPTLLSEYELFKIPLKEMLPNEDVVEYELNAPLFSDYTLKKRFIYLPPGSRMRYREKEVFDFPTGTMIFKFFYYPADFSDPDKEWTILETRVLIKEEHKWIALPYVWNETQDDAVLQIAGTVINAVWVREGRRESIAYSVPNVNDCKSCHDFKGELIPIGPTARQLNRSWAGSGVEINQLNHFSNIGWLDSLPSSEDVPFLVPWADTSFKLDLRARAYLEINCGHCHRPEGPAKTSALHLMASVTSPAELGIGKTPIAAGRGSGGLKYDIVPGAPEESILYYRMKSVEPGILMPEIGRKTVHQEGLMLIKQWIEELQ